MTRVALFLAFDVAAFAMIFIVWHAELILTFDRAGVQANVVSVQQRPMGRGETPYRIRYRFTDAIGQDHESSAKLSDLGANIRR